MQDKQPVLISKVALLDGKRVLIYPKSHKSSFQYIYREAAGVNWDDSEKCFSSTQIDKWDIARWYQHIFQTVKEGLGIQLILSEDTHFLSNSSNFVTVIKRADMELWR